MQRTDEIDEFISALPRKEQVLVQRLRSILFDVEPRIEEKFSFGVPYYKRNRMVCFIWPQSALYGPKKDLVSFGFCYGHMLSNDQGVLNHEGRTQVYIIRYSALQEIDEPVLREIIQEALLIDNFKFSDITRKRRKKK
jgi:hypothetical protein